RAVVDELGTRDLAALTYSIGVTRFRQGFTNDRARLLAAVDHMPMGFEDSEVECYCHICIHEAIASVADAMRDLRRQKTILVIGSEIKVTPDPFADAACWYDIKAAREKMYAALDRANAVL